MAAVNDVKPLFDLNASDDDDDDAMYDTPSPPTSTESSDHVSVAPLPRDLSAEPRAPAAPAPARDHSVPRDHSLPLPPVTLDLTEPSASRPVKKRRRSEWDKLTSQWFVNGAAAPEALPYSNSRVKPRAVAAAKKHVRQSRGEVKRHRATAPLDLTTPSPSRPRAPPA